MRQLGILPDAKSAQRLGDHLQSLSIETRLEQVSEGTVLWVLDEDKMPKAREELLAFQQNPADERFRAVSTPQPREARPEPPPRRRVRTGGVWAATPDRQLTLGLIVT